MKKNRLAFQLLKGYMLILLLIITIAIMAYLSYLTYTNNKLDASAIDMYEFIDDYNADKTTAFKKNNFQDNDFLVITDLNYKIIDSYNVDLEEGVTFHDIQVSDNILPYYAYYVFDSEEDNKVYHLYMEPYGEDALIYIIIITLFLICFVVMAYFYAKATSKTIIMPIASLREGVGQIASGQYGQLIHYHVKNELDEIRDEINHMSESLKEESEHRSRLEQERNELIMSLSHDIKTPLTNILGYSQMLVNKDLPSDIQIAVETINKYGQVAVELTDELFDYTKINNHKDFITESKDIVELLRLKLIDYIGELESLKIDYEFDLPDHIILCQVNTTMFNRVIDNLIQNSIKYNKEAFQITVSLKEKNDQVHLIIEDKGIGIPIQYHSTIFDPMVRVENSRSRETGGTGLGLSIAKKIMLKHEGSISLDPHYTDGCRFILTMPKEN